MKIEHFRALYLTGYKRDYEKGKVEGLEKKQNNEPDRVQFIYRKIVIMVKYHINHRQYRKAAYTLGICDGLGNSELEGVVERLMPT